MSTLSLGRRWYIAVLALLVLLLTWDISSRLQSSQQAIEQQFQANFKKDASRREGMRNLLARDVHGALQLALYSLTKISKSKSDGERAVFLKEAFSQMGFSLRNSRYDFFEAYLVQETPEGDLLLRGRYPRPSTVEGVAVSNTPLFEHVNLDDVALFTSNNEVYSIERSDLLGISNPQPVLVSTRLILDGSDGLSRWFVSLRVGVADTHRSIDLIGQQMAGGTTPMRVVNMDARNGKCQLVWEVSVGVSDCEDIDLDHRLNYVTAYDSEASKSITYSIYQPNDAYTALKLPSSSADSQWRAAIPIVLALLLLLTTAAYFRYRAASDDVLSSFADSLRLKDRVNTSIHDVLNYQLERMSQLAFAMRDGDIPESERRYFDIAISEFMQATLSLNTLRLQSPPVSASQRPLAEEIDLKELISLAQMVLEVSTIDTPVDAKLLHSDDLPNSVVGYGFSVQTALVAAISLSSETTDDGRIEVSLWVEEIDGFDCLNLRVIDSGIGWGLQLNEGSQEPENDDASVARKALIACLTHSGTELLLGSESDEQNEYHLQLCQGRPTATIA